MSRRKLTMVCPRCHGAGVARAFNRYPKYSEDTKARAEMFFEKGFTLREIAKRIKVTHPQTVKNILSYR